MIKITRFFEIYVMMNFIGMISTKITQSHGELFLNFSKVDSFSLVS